MPEAVEVLLPGPWWNTLTYISSESVCSGQRVQVPVGNGKRIGVIVDGIHKIDKKTRPINFVIDPRPVLGASFLRAVRTVADAFLVSSSEVLRSVLPTGFWKGNPFPFWSESINVQQLPTFLYEYDDEKRFIQYRQVLLGRHGGALCVFSERDVAKRFFTSLRGLVPKEQLFFWPLGSSAAERCWRKIVDCESPVIIGGMGAAAAPLSHPALFIVEDEANPDWRTVSFPHFSVRSLVAARARECGASLILGGRLPSSKIYRLLSSFPPFESKKQIHFVDLFKAPRVEIPGIRFPLPLSQPVLTKTLECIKLGQNVFWLLDRRGVTGEVHCSDCGTVIQCDHCGASMSYEKGALRCHVCGRKMPMPGRCPVCGSAVLEGTSPGLESLLPVARSLVGDHPVFLWHQENPRTSAEGKVRVAALQEQCGLVLGSRRALSLLELVNPALVCWLDADAEARRPEYDSRFSAYSMILESCCRSEKCEIVLQTRSPAAGWQIGLKAGWNLFWKNELKDRSKLGFPRFADLCRSTFPKIGLMMGEYWQLLTNRALSFLNRKLESAE